MLQLYLKMGPLCWESLRPPKYLEPCGCFEESVAVAVEASLLIYNLSHGPLAWTPNLESLYTHGIPCGN